MYFILNEGAKDNRFEATSNLEIYRSLEAIEFNTEPQDYEDGHLHICDTEGFNYDVRYIKRRNSVVFTRSQECYLSIEKMIKLFFNENRIPYDENISIKNNLDITISDKLILLQD